MEVKKRSIFIYGVVLVLCLVLSIGQVSATGYINYFGIAISNVEYNNLINTIVPVDYEKVASLIVMESGRKFSPKIVDSFKKVQSEFEAITKIGG